MIFNESDFGVRLTVVAKYEPAKRSRASSKERKTSTSKSFVGSSSKIKLGPSFNIFAI